MPTLAGCGGGSTFNVQNPPPPPPSSLSVAFQPAPVSSVLVNSTAQLTAVVSNDPGNFGVDWSVTCQNGNNCGSLNSDHSASGQAVTYTPPQTLSGNAETVNIVAFASADHTKNVVAAISVGAFGSFLGGTYVFQASGSDANLQPYQLAGAIILDSNGRITSGQQTLNSVSGSLTSPIAPSSSYFVGSDGRGTITINTNDQNGQPITEDFSLVVLSSSQAMIAELDTPQSSAGTLDLQTSRSAPGGSYGFVVSGTDTVGTPTAFGGVLNIDSPGSISGNGSLADQDYNNKLTTCSSPKGITGTVSQPDPNPLGTVIINLSGTPCLGTIQFTGYMVDADHMKLIESDNNGSSGFSTSGIAVRRATTGTFDLASLSGTYVWAILGQDMGSFEPSSLTSVGVVTADGSGNLTNGFTDTFLTLSAGTGLPAQSSGQFTGSYTIDTKGIGRVRMSLKQFSHPVPFRPTLIFYLTGNGTPPLVLDAGGENLNFPALGAGIAYLQAPGPLSFTGKYGVSFTQQNGGENDGTGQVIADATAQTSLTGLVDDSNFGLGNPVKVSDNFASPDSFGRVSGTFLGTAVEYYLIDSTRGFIVETDLVDPQLPSGQVALGQFAVRAPVCAACP